MVSIFVWFIYIYSNSIIDNKCHLKACVGIIRLKKFLFFTLYPYCKDRLELRKKVWQQNFFVEIRISKCITHVFGLGYVLLKQERIVKRNGKEIEEKKKERNKDDIKKMYISKTNEQDFLMQKILYLLVSTVYLSLFSGF